MISPVVAGLFRPGELVSVGLVVGGPEWARDPEDVDALWLRLVDRDSDTHWECLGSAADHLVSAVDLGWHLEDRITEWLSETSYAWGEERLLPAGTQGMFDGG